MKSACAWRDDQTLRIEDLRAIGIRRCATGRTDEDVTVAEVPLGGQDRDRRGRTRPGGACCANGDQREHAEGDG